MQLDAKRLRRGTSLGVRIGCIDQSTSVGRCTIRPGDHRRLGLIGASEFWDAS